MTCSGINVFTGSAVEVEFHETIESVVPLAVLPSAEGGEVGAELYLAPGWIDLQVNGFAGVDYNRPQISHDDTPDARLDEIARSLRVLFSTGVTRFYPTVITGPPDAMEQALRHLAHARDSVPGGRAMDGFHVEGPHICPDDGPRGAHPLRWVRQPDFDEFRRWQDATGNRVRIVTLSPEWPEAAHYIERITAEGVVASIGHTKASAQQIADAVSAGATLSTHLGNGAHFEMRRHPNYIWDQLAEDRLMAGFIADGIHSGPSFLKAAIRAKGVERSVLVTDASTPAGVPPGRYQMGEQAIELTADRRVVLAGTDRLAGSALRMDLGIENLMRLAELGLADAVRMATTNAARAGKVPARANGLAPGDRADLVQFRFDALTRRIEVTGTWLSGWQVY